MLLMLSTSNVSFMTNAVRQCSRMNAAPCQRLFPRLWPLGGTLLKGAMSVPQFDSLPLPLSPVQVGWSRFFTFVCGFVFFRQQVMSCCMVSPLVGLLSIYVLREQEGSSPSLKAAMLSFIGLLSLLRYCGIAAALPRLVVGRCSIVVCDPAGSVCEGGPSMSATWMSFVTGWH